MPDGIVRFEFSNVDIVEVESYDQLNLLAHAQMAERSVQSRCGGQCECSTCRIELSSGELSPMRDPERELLTRVGVPVDCRIRLACQSFPRSDIVVIRVPEKTFRDARK